MSAIFTGNMNLELMKCLVWVQHCMQQRRGPWCRQTEEASVMWILKITDRINYL